MRRSHKTRRSIPHEPEVNNINGVFVKAYPVRDADFRYSWKGQQDKCAACHAAVWRTYGGRWVWFEVHHVVKPGRSDEPTNLLLLCGAPCHLLAEGTPRVPDGDGYWPTLSMANCLWLKRESAPEEWNPERLAALLHRRLPEPERPHERFFVERERNSK